MGADTRNALLGILAGLLPAALGVFVAWIERRSQAAKRDRTLQIAHKRVEFLRTWLSTMETAAAPTHVEHVKQEVADELAHIKQGVAASMREEHRVAATTDENPLLQTAFLLYLPRSTRASVLHVLFYLCLGILVLSFWAFAPSSAPAEVGVGISVLTWFVLFGIPTTLIAFTVHVFARRADPKAPSRARPASRPPPASNRSDLHQS